MRVLQEELDDPEPRGLRALLGLHRPALRRAAGPGAGRAGRPPPALDADRARGQEDGAGRVGVDAQDPRGRPRRARLGARAVRRRRLVAGDRARPARRAASRTRSWPRWPTPSRGPARSRVGSWVTIVPSVRLGRRARAAGRAGGRGARRAGAVPAGARPRHARLSARWPTPCSRPPTSAALSRDRRRPRPAPACCSTTGASRAGRWRWSAASCARPGRSGSSRWPSRPRSEAAFAGAACPALRCAAARTGTRRRAGAATRPRCAPAPWPARSCVEAIQVDAAIPAALPRRRGGASRPSGCSTSAWPGSRPTTAMATTSPIG